jgi:Family of unknown function (DUF6065)
MNLKKLVKFWGNDVIEFYCHPDIEGVIPEPRSAVKNLPQWFKDLEPTYDNSDSSRDSFGNKPMTAKKCLPMLDAMSFGYMIPLAADLHVLSNHDNTKIQVTNPPGLKVCEFHESGQVGGDHKLGMKHGNPLKFINHWFIRTAPGWSVLFTAPLNHFNQPFTCLSGFVDTDAYPNLVNFPAVLNVYDADIHIPAGTPLVTAIPVKRNSFPKKPPIRSMTRKEIREVEKLRRRQDTRTHHYTYELRKRD